MNSYLHPGKSRQFILRNIEDIINEDKSRVQVF